MPNHPVSPVPTRNLALGLVAGVLLAVALALIRDATDRTVRTRETLDRVSGVPMLAELPRYATRRLSSRTTGTSAPPRCTRRRSAVCALGCSRRGGRSPARC